MGGKENSIRVALTFDDVLLVPQYSEILPAQVSLQTPFTRKIQLSIPLVSAAMDTVTEDKMAITIALHGGIGVIHKNCDPESQAEMVAKVKRFENGFIRNPLILSPQHKIAEAVRVRREMGFKAIPITEDGTPDSPVVGLITRNDYLEHKHAALPIRDRMTPVKDLLTAREPMDLSEANTILEESKYSKLLVLKSDRTLSALLTRRDMEKNEQFPFAAKDERKRLLVAAAVGPAENMRVRVQALVEAGVDALVVDTAHGHSKGVIDTIKFIKKNYPKMEVVGGNIASAAAAKDLIAAGVDGLKVGIGPGSICTTRVIAGVGVPQFSAIWDVYEVAKKAKIPVIADGGIKFSGDIAKALAAGASSVMIGSLLAGTDESPGEFIYSGGQTFKYYRGMGSIAAMVRGGKERYSQAATANEKLVPEGIEGKILYKGTAAAEIFQLCGGVRSSMGYNGVKTIPEFPAKSQFVRITASGLKESHPHNVSVFKEAPNYR